MEMPAPFRHKTRPKTPLAAPQKSFDKLFTSLEDYVANLQDSASDSRSLQWGIDKYLAANPNLTPRQLVGLGMKIDTEWVQEYAARCGCGGLAWGGTHLTKGGGSLPMQAWRHGSTPTTLCHHLCARRTRSPSRMSLNWFDNGADLPGGDTIMANGYNQLPDYLYGLLTAKGGRVVLNAPVTAVTYGPSGVTVRLGALARTRCLPPSRLCPNVLPAGTLVCDERASSAALRQQAIRCGWGLSFTPCAPACLTGPAPPPCRLATRAARSPPAATPTWAASRSSPCPPACSRPTP